MCGPTIGLPATISGVNSYWLRGYGDPPPETVIVLGFESGKAASIFGQCEIAAKFRNAYGAMN